MPVSKLPASTPTTPATETETAEKSLMDYATLGLTDGRAGKVVLPDASPDAVLAYRAGVYFSQTLIARFTMVKKSRGKSIRIDGAGGQLSDCILGQGFGSHYV